MIAARLPSRVMRSSYPGALPLQPLRRVVVETGEEGAEVLDELGHGGGRVEDGLVLGDVVLERAHLEEVHGPDLHRAELLDLAVAREDAGPARAQLLVLVKDAELDREPEDVGEELETGVTLAAARGLARQQVELGELRRREQVAVADHLVDQIGLGRVEGSGRVADVLRRVEYPVGERAVELPERYEPRGGHVAEA